MRKNLGTAYTLPVTFWITLFFVIPLTIIACYSFMKKGLYGGVEWSFSIDAYKALFNKAFLKVTFATIKISVITTIVTVVLALPAGYFIARSKHKNIFLMMVIIPFWTDFMVRIYAWKLILAQEGIITWFANGLGLGAGRSPLGAPLELTETSRCDRFGLFEALLGVFWP